MLPFLISKVRHPDSGTLHQSQVPKGYSLVMDDFLKIAGVLQHSESSYLLTTEGHKRCF